MPPGMQPGRRQQRSARLRKLQEEARSRAWVPSRTQLPSGHALRHPTRQEGFDAGLSSDTARARKLQNSLKRRRRFLASRDDTLRFANSRTGSYYGKINLRESSRAILGDVHCHFHTGSETPTSSDLVDLAVGFEYQSASPHGILESSPAFRPSFYTIATLPYTFCAYSAHELVSTPTIRVDELSIACASDHGYHNIIVRLVTQARSKAWLLTRPFTNSGTWTHTIPPSFLEEIQRCISKLSIVEFRTYTVVSGSLLHLQNEVIRATGACEPSTLHSKLAALTKEIPHWLCPWYHEKQIDRRPLYPNRGSPYFLARFEGEWARCTRFASRADRFEDQVYTLKTLCQLRGVEGVTKFKGLLRNNHGLITAFLSEMPAKGNIWSLIRAEAVSFERRVKWCEQLIRVVAHMHQSMLVIGMLVSREDTLVGIDAGDNVVLQGIFSRTIHLRSTNTPPPECNTEYPKLKATYATDLYQLGHVLWRIISARDATTYQRVVCHMAGCRHGEVCKTSHIDPRCLPFDDFECPNYLKNIILLCTSQDLCERLPAHQLLQMFPAGHNHLQGHDSISKQVDLSRAETFLEMYASPLVYCDLCARTCSDSFFHCGVCRDGNFDICDHCFRMGMHCPEVTHILGERQWCENQGKFYTKPDPFGLRQQVSLDDVTFTVL